MKLRMCSLWLAGVFSCACSLWFAATLFAEPPKAEPASSVAVDRAKEKTSSPMPVDRDEAQILIEAVIYEVDQAKLVKLAETSPSPVKELLKANGFKLPKASEKRSMLTAIRDEPLSLKNQEVNEAFKERAAPSIVALAGHSATFRSGGEFPVPASKDSFTDVGPKIGFREFRTGVSLLPLIEADGKIALDIRVEETTVDRDNSVEVSGIEVPASRSQAMSLAAKLKSGQYLLIANGTTEADLTQFVQLKVRVLTAEEIRQLAPVRPATAVQGAKPVINALPETQPESPEEFSVFDRWPVRKLEVGEVVYPWVVRAETHQLFVAASLVGGSKEMPYLFNETVCRVVSIKPMESGGGQIVTLLPQGLSAEDRQRLAEKHRANARAALTLAFVNAHRGLVWAEEAQKILDRVPTNVWPAAMELQVGGIQKIDINERRLISQSSGVIEHEIKDRATFVTAKRPGDATLIWQYSLSNSGLFAGKSFFRVNGETAAAQSNSVAAAEASVAQPALKNENNVTIEDRWPLREIKVGQMVFVFSVQSQRHQLVAQICQATSSDDDSICEVVAVQPNPKGKGRTVTLRAIADDPKRNVKPSDTINHLRETADEALSMFVIPVTQFSLPLYLEVLDAIPPEALLKPVELFVGASHRLMLDSKCVVMEQDDQVIQVQEPESKPDSGFDAFGNAVGLKPGIARLTYLRSAGDLIGAYRMTFHVKADTRELEHHLREQFPKSNVTITSLGTNSLLLSGTAASEDDSRGIVELAEQFAPKVLNRLRVGSPASRGTHDNSGRNRSISVTEQNLVQQASGSVDAAKSNSTDERGGGNASVDRDRANLLGTDAAPLAKLPRVVPASATSSKKSDHLCELLDEIRELRREVQSLSERLEREASKSATSQKPEDASPNELDKLVAEFNELMSQRRFSNAEDIAMRANELLPGHETVRVMLLRSRFAQKNWQDNPAGHFEKLVSQFDHLMREKRFAEAEVIGKQAKEIMLGEPGALMLMKAQQARRMQSREQSEPKQDTHAEQNRANVLAPPSRMKSKLVGATKEDRAVAAKLDTDVMWEMVDLPLSVALEHLADDVGINIVLDKRGLEEAGVDPDARINVTIKGVKLSSALKIVLEPLRLSYAIDGEVLKVTSQERAAGPLVVVAYPMTDLLHDKEDVFAELEHFIDLIRSNVAPEAWDKVGGQGSIIQQATTKLLLVRQSNAVHDELQGFLNLLRKTANAANAKLGPAGLSHLSDEEIRITQQLQKSVSLEFEQVTLIEACRKLSALAGINVVLDQAGLEEEGLSGKTLVSLRLKEVRLSSALRLLLEPLNLAYMSKNEVLVITSQARAEGQLVVASYSVPDLVRDGGSVNTELDRLGELIQSMIEPDSWREVGGAAVIKANPLTQSLVVRQTAANQTRVRELLETMRSVGKHKVTKDE